MTDVFKTYADEPAYPTGVDKEGINGGLTKREHFAAMMMQALVGNAFYAEKIQKSKLTQSQDLMLFSRMALDYADALISALNEFKS